MKCHLTPLAGVLLLEPNVFSDARGSFMESWNARTFAELTGTSTAFVQDNESVSAQGAVRGLHYQLPPHAQGKLVRVLRGAILDVVVDLRRDSPTFGQHHSIRLDDKSRLQLWIPPGFAHGFMALQAGTRVFYKTTHYYHHQSERAIRWDCPELKIAWPALNVQPQLTDKDAAAPGFATAEIPLTWN